MTEYLATSDIRKALIEKPMPDDKTAYQLRRFIIDNDIFDNKTYRTYVGCLPRHFKGFRTDLAKDKLRIIIEEGKATFSWDNFHRFSEYYDLQVLFVARNFATFTKKPDGIDIDDEFRMALLQSDISDEEKFKVIRELNPTSILSEKDHAASLGAILKGLNQDVDDLDFDLIRAVVAHAQPVDEQILLLNKCHKSLSPEEVRIILGELPAPYSDIASFGKSPRIRSTPTNRKFATWLEEVGVISSSTPTYLEREIKINTFKGKRGETTEQST